MRKFGSAKGGKIEYDMFSEFTFVRKIKESCNIELRYLCKYDKLQNKLQGCLRLYGPWMINKIYF